MTKTWDEARLQQYIDDEIQENLNLDYKDYRSLAKSDGKKREITKDVSAMANSDGGLIIYGIGEFQEKDKSHLPEKITPIDRTEFSKEWLEHIIANIRPKVEEVRIYPVDLSSGDNDVAYVVDIPKSNTAHQAKDKRYYKRFNFESVAMEDYEIRDVMSRGKHPNIDITAIINQKNPNMGELILCARNKGSVYAKYVNATIEIPDIFTGFYHPKIVLDETKYIRFLKNNTYKDINFIPILPNLIHEWRFDINLTRFITHANNKIFWRVYVDNAPPKSGEILLSDIKINYD